MNYRHAYHAGNFADVFKHALLVGLIEALKTKQTPFCYFDSHAGSGRYDLAGDEASKTREAADGILRMLPQMRMPSALHIYLNLVRSLNERRAEHELTLYPGSPMLAQLLMREHDRAVLCELQPHEARNLKALFRDEAQVHVHQRDGYEAMRALLPPSEKRGLVLIDPAYEAQQQEFDSIQSALAETLKRWPSGCYAVWYPIKLRSGVQPFKRWLSRCQAAKVLNVELLLHPDNSSLRLNGCGMAILNPPWRFERAVEEITHSLCEHLAQSRFSEQHVEWLRGE